MGLKEDQEIRKPAVAGSFYPGEEEDLEQSVKNLLQAEVKALSGVKGIMAPHAGYMFSGTVAGMAYSVIRNLSPDVVVIIGPSHQEYFDGICVYQGKAYQTPLGELEVDKKLREQIVSFGKPIISGIMGHRSKENGEHCIEIQLPFLQKIFTDFKILPIIMGEQKWEYCEFLGNALSTILKNRSALIVASSDLSHYHSYEVAQGIDAQFISILEQGDPKQLAVALERRDVEACGGGPVVATLYASQKLGANKVQILLYQNSGDVWVDKTQVVGYLAAVFRQ